MSEGKHTPGPWTVDNSDIDGSTRGYIRGPRHDKQLRHNLKGPAICRVAYVFSAEECDANAHLIAAAPELLAALEALYPHCHEATMQGETDYERAWLKAEAALRKAKGE